MFILMVGLTNDNRIEQIFHKYPPLATTTLLGDVVCVEWRDYSNNIRITVPVTGIMWVQIIEEKDSYVEE